MCAIVETTSSIWSFVCASDVRESLLFLTHTHCIATNRTGAKPLREVLEPVARVLDVWREERGKKNRRAVSFSQRQVGARRAGAQRAASAETSKNAAKSRAALLAVAPRARNHNAPAWRAARAASTEEPAIKKSSNGFFSPTPNGAAESRAIKPHAVEVRTRDRVEQRAPSERAVRADKTHTIARTPQQARKNGKPEPLTFGLRVDERLASQIAQVLDVVERLLVFETNVARSSSHFSSFFCGVGVLLGNVH